MTAQNPPIPHPGHPTRLLTVREAAAILRLSPSRVTALIRSGRLPARKNSTSSRKWLVNRADLLIAFPYVEADAGPLPDDLGGELLTTCLLPAQSNVDARLGQVYDDWNVLANPALRKAVIARLAQLVAARVSPELLQRAWTVPANTEQHSYAAILLGTELSGRVTYLDHRGTGSERMRPGIHLLRGRPAYFILADAVLNSGERLQRTLKLLYAQVREAGATPHVLAIATLMNNNTSAELLGRDPYFFDGQRIPLVFLQQRPQGTARYRVFSQMRGANPAGVPCCEGCRQPSAVCRCASDNLGIFTGVRLNGHYEPVEEIEQRLQAARLLPHH